MKKNKLVSRLCLALAIVVVMSLSCVPVFASSTDIAPVEAVTQIESIPPAVDTESSATETMPADDADAAAPTDAEAGTEQGEAVDGSVDSEPTEAPDESETDAGDPADAEDEVKSTTDAGIRSRNRYMVVGGIALAVCIAFYIFLSVKTKKRKK